MRSVAPSIESCLQRLSQLASGEPNGCAEEGPERGSRRNLDERLTSAGSLKLLVWVILLVGVGLRISQFAFDRSLFLDEAFVATNIRDRSYLELLQPLEFDQRAPAGFLFAVKLAWNVFGEADWVLRLVPLLAGVASLFAFRAVIARVLQPATQVLAMILFAWAVPQIFYASDLKQYSTDVLMTLLAIHAFLVTDGQRLPWSAVVHVGLCGMLALLFSFPAVFVLAALGGCTAVAQISQREWPRLGRLSAARIWWAIGCATFYFAQCQHFDPNPGWKSLWGDAFLPASLATKASWKWMASRLFHLVAIPGGIAPRVLAALLFLFGVLRWLQVHPLRAMWFLGPIVVTFMAALVNFYPFSGRVILFTAPLVVVIVCYGIQELPRLHKDWNFLAVSVATFVIWRTHYEIDGFWLGVAIAGCLTYHVARRLGDRWQYVPQLSASAISVIVAVSLVIAPAEGVRRHIVRQEPYSNPLFWKYQFEDLKPAIAFMRDNWREGDVVYLYSMSYVAFEFYANRYGFEQDDWVRGIEAGLAAPSREAIRDDLQQLAGRPRTWVLFTHVWMNQDISERELYLRYLDEMGQRTKAFELPPGYDAAVYLYDLSSSDAQLASGHNIWEEPHHAQRVR